VTATRSGFGICANEMPEPGQGPTGHRAVSLQSAVGGADRSGDADAQTQDVAGRDALLPKAVERLKDPEPPHLAEVQRSIDHGLLGQSIH
jgi:hypothetical protein